MATIFELKDAMTLSGARAVLTQMPEKLEDGQGVIPLTRHGKPVLAIMTWDLYESLSETIAVLSDPVLMAQLRDQGESRPLSEVRAEIERGDQAQGKTPKKAKR